MTYLTRFAARMLRDREGTALVTNDALLSHEQFAKRSQRTIDELAEIGQRVLVERNRYRDMLIEVRPFVADLFDYYGDIDSRIGTRAGALLAKIDAALGESR